MSATASTVYVRPRAFYPALDGLRAVAFLAVFAFHYGVPASSVALLRWGWIGVDIFFVLSGFLITGILFDSLDEPHFFRSFYIRRTLRIFPLFYGFWLVMLLLAPLLGLDWNRYNVAMAAYIGNFFRASSYLHVHPDPGLLSCSRLLPKSGIVELDVIPLWSLCVEEQFYLLWPAVVWLVRSRTRLLGLCIAVFLAEPFLRELYWRIWPLTAAHGAVYLNTFTRIDTLLAGAAIALWLRGPGVRIRTLKQTAYALLLLPLPILAALVLRFSSPNPDGSPINWINDHTVNIAGFSLITLFSTGLLLLAIQPDTWLYKLLRRQPWTAIGRRSYGLYFFHALPLYLLFFHLWPHLQHRHLGFLLLPVALAYTFIAAWLSFRYLESPFLRLKDRLAPKRNRVSDPQPV